MDPQVLAGWAGVIEDMAADEALILRACQQNPWFVPATVRFALERLAPWCEQEGLAAFARRYPSPHRQLTVGLIMAGNVPMVGFHDLVVALLSGHRAVVKPSSKDRVLLEELLRHSPEAVRKRVDLVADIVPGTVDAVIATGSDQTARLLERRFAGTPQCIRHSRFSVGILDGAEDARTLEAVADAVLLHHGMGCRSLSCLVVPAVWESVGLLAALEGWRGDWLAPAWEGVVRMARAQAVMSGTWLGGERRIALVAAARLAAAAPGCLHVLSVSSDALLREQLTAAKDQLQSVYGSWQGAVPFADAQCPTLDTFADGVDTMQWLTQLG